MARRAIINADDLGWSLGVTDGILQAHRQGLVTSATLAVNMPDAERAAAAAVSLPNLGVGVHLNACQGPPLSAAGAVLTNGDGMMRFSGPGLVARCLRKPGTVRAVLAEFEAQICRARELGIRPTHLDSHRHVHAFPSLFAGVVRLALKHGIPWVRWPCERLSGRDWPKAPRGQVCVALALEALCALSAKAARPVRVTQGTWGIAHTGHIDSQWLMHAAEALPEGTTEIMVHPGFAEDLGPQDSRLRESRRSELESLCDPAVRDAFGRSGCELVHYGQLSHEHA